jgi:hypothetical protein
MTYVMEVLRWVQIVAIQEISRLQGCGRCYDYSLCIGQVLHQMVLGQAMMSASRLLSARQRRLGRKNCLELASCCGWSRTWPPEEARAESCS